MGLFDTKIVSVLTLLCMPSSYKGSGCAGLVGVGRDRPASSPRTRTPRRTCAIVDVEHQRLRALDEDTGVFLLGVVDEGDGIDNIVRQLLAVALETLNLVIHVVYEGVAESLLVPGGKFAQSCLEKLGTEHLADGDSAPCGRGGIAGADAALRGSDGVGAQLNLLGLVDSAVEVEVDVASVGDEDALVDILQALLLDRLELREERRHVDDNARADQVEAVGIHEARGQEVEIVADTVRVDGVAGIVTSLYQPRSQ